jgi:integrase/recombinase XerD
MVSSGLAPSSVNRFFSAIKGFYKYCALEYHITNPTVDISQFKIARKLPKALSITEISSLIESAGVLGNVSSLRDRLILEMLYGTGARVAELVGIDINDISKDSLDGEDIVILKLRGKGSKERFVPLGKYAQQSLEDYLVRLRPALLAKNSQNERALLLNARGQRLTRQSAWNTVLKAAKTTGLEGRVSPHVFRHSYATHLLDGGARYILSRTTFPKDIHLIQRHLSLPECISYNCNRCIADLDHFFHALHALCFGGIIALELATKYWGFFNRCCQHPR